MGEDYWDMFASCNPDGGIEVLAGGGGGAQLMFGAYGKGSGDLLTSCNPDDGAPLLSGVG